MFTPSVPMVKAKSLRLWLVPRIFRTKSFRSSELCLTCVLFSHLLLYPLVDRVNHTDLFLSLEILEVPAKAQHVRPELRRRLFCRDVDTGFTVACCALVQILPTTYGLPTSGTSSQ